MPKLAVEDKSRISLRIPVEEKDILLRAAALRGTDLTNFIRQQSVIAAKAVIYEENEKLLAVAEVLLAKRKLI